jgi:copper homeostasis protein
MAELEVCANSLASALAAQEGGAIRVELCENLADGGTTPSYGQIALTRKMLNIEVFPIIRPRGGDFLYSDVEFEIMKFDVLACKELGCDGVVFGILNPDGTIDQERCKALMDLAAPMEVSFHRAFDMTRDLSEAMETLIDLGFQRVLSSGGRVSAMEGAGVLTRLIEQAADRIQVMPGAGINPSNVKQLLEKTGAKVVHASLMASQNSRMVFRNEQSKMGAVQDEYAFKVTSLQLVRDLVNELH